LTYKFFILADYATLALPGMTIHKHKTHGITRLQASKILHGICYMSVTESENKPRRRANEKINVGDFWVERRSELA
jgi:hypothetical protein